MKLSKIAFFSASCLIIGATALSAPSLAADAPAKKPAALQPIVKPEAHDMTAAGDAQKECMMSGRMGGHMGGMMGGQMGDMKCDQMGGMKCDHMGGMKCDHMGGMKCDHMGGMKCDHMGGMKCDHMGGMKCDHMGGMMGGQMGGNMGCMMGGHGAGMMGSQHAHMLMSLGLSDEQRARINKLSDELKHDNWATKGLIMDESAKLRDLYAADKRDPSAIGKVYQKIFDLKRKMIEATIASQNRIEEVLTPEQRTQLKDMHHKGAMDKCPMH